jgi:hypothetical protein
MSSLRETPRIYLYYSAFHFCFWGISWLSISSGFGFSIIKHTGLVVYRPVTGLGGGIFTGGVP